jgi:hypothetical protein
MKGALAAKSLELDTILKKQKRAKLKPRFSISSAKAKKVQTMNNSNYLATSNSPRGMANSPKGHENILNLMQHDNANDSF